MKRSICIVLIFLLCLSFAGCGKIKSTDLSNVVINGYTVQDGKNDVFAYSISKEDVIGALGNNYNDGIYDYAQCLKVMKYHDTHSNIKMDFVYLKTENGEIINWIDAYSKE